MQCPNLTRQGVYECFINTDEQYCDNFFKNRVTAQQESWKAFQFSKSEERDILRTYQKIENSIYPNDGCLIGVGYNNCED